MDEGVIKFDCDWVNEALPVEVPHELIFWRNKMRELKLIGEYADVKIGYGNISIKTEKSILISGSQTGHIYPIKANNFALVTSYDMDTNRVSCVGKVKASAESLTHAAIYESDNSIKAIIHVHTKLLWNQLMDQVPTTNKLVPYGTAKMGLEIKRLFKETNVAEEKIIIMGGHEDGVVTFGKNLKEAGRLILNYAT